MEVSPTEQELFSQTFEEHTRMSRLLRVRCGTKAILCNRTLSGMKRHVSATQVNSAEFEIDNFLAPKRGAHNFVNVVFQGIFAQISETQPWFSSGGNASIKATLSKINKDRPTEHEEIKDSFVTINPVSVASEYCVASIPAHNMLDDQHTSYKLVFVVRIPYNQNLDNITQLQRESITHIYGCELVIFEKSTGFVRAGNFQIALHELPDNRSLSATTNSSLEALPDALKLVSIGINNFKKNPMLKLQVAWSASQVPDQIMPLDMRKYGFSEFKCWAVKAQKMSIAYNFLCGNYKRHHTDNTEELNCPLCGLTCARLFSLLTHLHLWHSRFLFSWHMAHNSVHIDVSINVAYDESATPLACFINRTCEPSLTETVKEHDTSNAESVHKRQYYHSTTLLPIHPTDFDIDSEDEVEPEWLHHKRTQKIDKNIHLNDGEKAIMKMWNLHIIKYGFVGKSQMLLACDMFVENHGQELFSKNLYRNYVLHLCNLCDFSIISAEDMRKNLLKLKSITSADQTTNE